MVAKEKATAAAVAAAAAPQKAATTTTTTTTARAPSPAPTTRPPTAAPTASPTPATRAPTPRAPRPTPKVAATPSLLPPRGTKSEELQGGLEIHFRLAFARPAAASSWTAGIPSTAKRAIRMALARELRLPLQLPPPTGSSAAVVECSHWRVRWGRRSEVALYGYLYGGGRRGGGGGGGDRGGGGGGAWQEVQARVTLRLTGVLLRAEPALFAARTLARLHSPFFPAKLAAALNGAGSDRSGVRAVTRSMRLTAVAVLRTTFADTTHTRHQAQAPAMRNRTAATAAAPTAAVSNAGAARAGTKERPSRAASLQTPVSSAVQLLAVALATFMVSSVLLKVVAAPTEKVAPVAASAAECARLMDAGVHAES